MKVVRNADVGQPVPEHVELDEPGVVEKSAAVEDGDDALEVIAQGYEPYTPQEERKLLWKIDLRVCTLMFFLQGLQFVDKNTLSYAGTYGIIAQDHLVGQQYSLLVSLFYIGYLVAQYPAAWMMQHFSVNRFICVNFVLWGVTLAGTSAATSFPGLAAARFILGLFESCVTPGLILTTSSWYKREEQTARVGFWTTANGFIGGPSGLIFWAIAHIHAHNWFPSQWMFLIFGIFTALFGVALWWLLPESPVTAKFLNERERIIAVERLRTNNTGVKNSHHKSYQIKEALTDIKVWMLVAAVFVHNMTNSLQNTFTGIIIKSFGYSTYEAVLLNLPQYGILIVVIAILVTFLGTRYGEGKRIMCIVLMYIPGIVSSVILYRSPVTEATRGLHLYAVFTILLVTCVTVIHYALLAGNIAGYTKKTVAGCMFFSAYCVANIISPQTFLQSQSPKYSTGVAVTLTCFCINIVLFICLGFMYYFENKRRDRLAAEAGESVGTAETLVTAFSDLTDKENPAFRYKY